MGHADRSLNRLSATHLTAFAIVLLAMAVALWSLASPAVRSADRADAQFSANLAMEHVAAIAVEPHPVGSEAIGRVREYIVGELTALGIQVELQTAPARDPYGVGELIAIVNVIADIPGTASTGAIVLMAHHDTVPETPGANDNTAAVGALLETARVLTSGPPVRNDVILLFTDAEEPSGRAGAREFLTGAVRRDVQFVVNFEALGESGPSLLAELSGGAWVLAEFDAAVSHPAAFSFLTGLAEIFGEIGTDFDPFRVAGYDGLNFAYLRGSPIYHTAADSVERIGGSSLQHHGSHAVGIVRHFGDLDFGEDREGGRVVFTSVGPMLVRHPATWTIALSLTAMILAAWFLVRRRQLPGTGRVVAAGTASLLVGSAAWLGLGAARSTVGVVESYIYLGGLLAGTILLAYWLTGSTSRKGSGPGVVTVWIALAFVTSLLAPGLSMMLAWPALTAAAALLWRPTGALPATVRFGLVVFPTIVLVVPAIDVFWQMAQPRPGNPDSELLWAVLLPLLLGLLVFGLIAAFWPRPDEAN